MTKRDLNKIGLFIGIIPQVPFVLSIIFALPFLSLGGDGGQILGVVILFFMALYPYTLWTSLVCILLGLITVFSGVKKWSALILGIVLFIPGVVSFYVFFKPGLDLQNNECYQIYTACAKQKSEEEIARGDYGYDFDGTECLEKQALCESRSNQ